MADRESFKGRYCDVFYSNNKITRSYEVFDRHQLKIWFTYSENFGEKLRNIPTLWILYFQKASHSPRPPCFCSFDSIYLEYFSQSLLSSLPLWWSKLQLPSGRRWVTFFLSSQSDTPCTLEHAALIRATLLRSFFLFSHLLPEVCASWDSGLFLSLASVPTTGLWLVYKVSAHTNEQMKKYLFSVCAVKNQFQNPIGS